MPAPSWGSFALPQLPPGVPALASQVGGVVDAAKQVLALSAQLFELLSGIEIDNPNAGQLASQAAIKAMQAALASLLDNSGVYVLMVPARKKIVLAPVVQAALDATGLKNLPAVTAGAETVGVRAAVAKGYAKFDPDTARFFQTSASAEGGNAGFYRSVVESLADDGDDHRPQFTDANYVAGFTVIAGATDYVSLLNFMTVVGTLIPNRRPGVTLDAATLPTPQDLKTVVTYVPEKKALAVLLSWKYQQPRVSVPSISTTVLVDRIAVIRSTSPLILSQRTPHEIFGTNQLAVGLKAGGTEVVAIYRHTVVAQKSTYYDTSPLTSDQNYYYAVCFALKAGTPGDLLKGAGADLGFGALSGVVKVRYALPAARASGGTPPDWYRTSSVADLFPSVATFLRRMATYVAQLENGVQGDASQLKAYAQFLTDEVDALSTFAENTLGVVERSIALLAQPLNVGAYVRPFAGDGGLTYFLQDLATGLGDKSDPGRPPFDRGDEFVLGFVVLAGAPSAADLAPVQALLASHFSGQPEATALASAIAQIEAVVVAQETVLFADNLAITPLDPGIGVFNTPLQVGADDAPGVDTNCPPPPSTIYVFGPDLKIQA